MGDPRGACPKLIDRQNRIQIKKKGVFDAIGNLAEIEALEKLGIVDNQTRRGLVSIAVASNIIRSGNPSNDGWVKALLRVGVEGFEEGANVILDATGIGRVGLDAINAIDAQTANRGLGAAKQVFKKARKGEFGITDIPDAITDIQNLEKFLRGLYKGGVNDSNSLSRFKCQPSPYALDLVHRAPKMKFMYIVEIKFSDPYAALNRVAATMAFITKSAARPSVEFEYEEVNMYNYRTEVLKRVVFQPVQLRFIDDAQGNTMRFYELYLKALSPISNIDIGAASTQIGTLENQSMGFDQRNAIQFSERFPDQSVKEEERAPSVAQGFEQARTSLQAKVQGVRNTLSSTFGNKQQQEALDKLPGRVNNGQNETVSFPRYASSSGTLVPSNPGSSDSEIYHKNMLQSITIHHIGDYGDSITSFQMFNPRITSFQPDELTMAETGDGSEMMLEFKYDSMLISPNVPMHEFGSERLVGITGGDVGATYPIYQTGITEGVKQEGGGANVSRDAATAPPVTPIATPQS